mmetsp:Transcript_522/g.1302  ORF Transcript_522/g.1302 Transcript_522/m.1302 type:complete len:235 (+) Transcript_522:1-705(+)
MVGGCRIRKQGHAADDVAKEFERKLAPQGQWELLKNLLFVMHVAVREEISIILQHLVAELLRHASLVQVPRHLIELLALLIPRRVVALKRSEDVGDNQREDHDADAHHANAVSRLQVCHWVQHCPVPKYSSKRHIQAPQILGSQGNIVTVDAVHHQPLLQRTRVFSLHDPYTAGHQVEQDEVKHPQHKYPEQVTVNSDEILDENKAVLQYAWPARGCFESMGDLLKNFLELQTP